MALATGSRFGPYEILNPLGAGGMGEVYRARDTRLGRDVAIKVLPQHLSSNSDVKARFEREARAISALSHPHICHLYDVGSQDGTDFIVMELLEGESLAERLQKGALPLKQALEFGIEIAEALEKAHKHGIVHRDLKPGNVMLTKSGAKLLDFGLAKPAKEMAAMASGSVETMSKPLTGEGKIVGTFQYMAPEQIHGENADARTDIFALGAVLYEMVTGRRAFGGKSQISVMSAILEKEPDPISNVQPLTPPALDHVIRGCLAKDRDERYQSASDVRLELRWITEERQGTAPPATQGHPQPLITQLLAGALAVAGLAAGVTYYATRPGEGLPLMASVVPPAGVYPDTSGRNGPPQISPDGVRLAFVGCKTLSVSALAAGSEMCSIWLKSIRSSDVHEVAGTGGGYAPFWSPDGKELGFFAEGKLKRVSADGGPVQVICDADDARGGSWNGFGTIIFAATRGSPIFRVPVEGGTPVAITRFASSVTSLSEAGSHRWPHFLPDGKHFLYVTEPNGDCAAVDQIHFASLDGKQDISLIQGCSSAGFANGRLIFWRDGNLVAQPFDPSHGVLNGTAIPIVEHVAFDSLFAFAEFSASDDGRLVYMTGERATGSQLVWYDRSGKALGTLGEDDQYNNLAISPDGSRVATAIPGPERTDIWVLDARGSKTRLTSGSGGDFPAWAADGRQVYFASNLGGPYDIFVKAADGSGDARPVVNFEKGRFGAVFLTVSPDGKFLVFVTSDPSTKLDIYLVPLTGDHKPQPFLHSTANESAPAISSDGKWLAYESDQSGRNEIYVTPFPAGGAQYQVSTAGGERPLWSHNGREIFYRAMAHYALTAVAVNIKGPQIQLGAPEPLFEMPVRNRNGRYYDVAPDGRFLTNTSLKSTQSPNFELLANWPAALKK